jgi:hypothetical protein
MPNAPSGVEPLPRIIGLYSGGISYAEGIFHPAGNCLMRDLANNELCAVCRYILVDLINPQKHKELDFDYAVVYPQK